MASRPTASSASSRGRRHPRLPPLLRLPPHIDPELNDSLWFDSPASEFRGIYSGPFDLEWIRGLERDERKRYVIGLCNWHMFANNFIRGPEFADRSEWVTVIESTATIGNLEIKARIGGHEEFVGDPKYYEENPELSENPPHELLAEYHRPWPVLEHDKYGPESANRDLVKAEYLLEILNESWDNWSAVRHKERVNKVAEKAEIAISKIPNPERINKVVCIALGALASHIVEPATNRFERWRYRFQSGSIAQHMLAAATARVIQQKTRQPVKLYSSDPRYGIQHQRALAAFPAFSFTLLDPRWGRHEAFTLIDDSTVVIELSAYFCPTLDLIQSYARPVAIITERPFYQEDLDLSKFPAGTKVGVGSSAKWYDVKITDPDGNETWAPIPGKTAQQTKQHTARTYEMLKGYDTVKEFPEFKPYTGPEGPGEDGFTSEFDLFDFQMLPAQPPDSRFARCNYEVDDRYWAVRTRLFIRRDEEEEQEDEGAGDNGDEDVGDDDNDDDEGQAGPGDMDMDDTNDSDYRSGPSESEGSDDEYFRLEAARERIDLDSEASFTTTELASDVSPTSSEKRFQRDIEDARRGQPSSSFR